MHSRPPPHRSPVKTEENKVGKKEERNEGKRKEGSVHLVILVTKSLRTSYWML